jgi:hypothetical protein
VSAVAVAAVLAARPVCAQAWLPPAGVGDVTLAVQRIDNTGHLLSDGSLIEAGQSLSTSVLLEVEYSLTDRLQISAGIPFVGTRYTDPNPPPPFVPALDVDLCRCWHSGLQDLSLSARFNVVSARGFALTPSIAFGVPSHDYDFRGEAVIGRGLKEARFGVDVGQRLDAISPKLAVQGRYSYAVVEQVLDIPNNRSNAALEGAYQVTRAMSVRGTLAWQHTHGGLRFGSPPPSTFLPPGDVNTPERLFQHDRLLRDDSFHWGGGASYSFKPFDVFASWLRYQSGTDSHAGHVFTVGVSIPFETGPLFK